MDLISESTATVENCSDVIATETIHSSELPCIIKSTEYNESVIPMLTSLVNSNGSIAVTPWNIVDDVQRSDADEVRSVVETMVISILMCICILTTIVGNLLVVVSVLTYPPLKCPPQNHFLVSLACADLAVATLVMPWHVVTFASGGRWPFGATLCRAWLTFDILTCTSSILHLCVIALDRYNAIHDPIGYAVKRTLRRVLIKIAVVWVVSSLISVPPLFSWNNGSTAGGDSLYDAAEQRCHFTDERGFVVYSALGSFFIPLMAMTFLYVRIFLATRARLRARVRSLHSGSSRRSNQQPLIRISNDAREPVKSSPTPEMKALSIKEVGNCSKAPNGSEQFLKVATDSIPEMGDETIRRTGSHASTSNPTSVDGYRSIMETGISERSHKVIVESALETGSHKTKQADDRMKPKVLPLSAKSALPSNERHNNKAGVQRNVARTDQQFRRSSSIAFQFICCEWKSSGVDKDAIEQSQMSRFIEARHRLSLSRERRAARTAGIVVGAFVICWMPFFITYLIFPFCNGCAARVGDGIVRLVVWLGYLNSSLNPIIYTVFNVDFRTAFKNILLCLCRKVTNNYKIR